MLHHPHVRFDKAYTTAGSYTSGTLPDRAALKKHLRVDFDDDDAYIDTVLLTTISYIEEYCDVVLAQATFKAYWDYAYPLVLISKNFGSIRTTGEDAPTFEVLNSSGTYETVPSADYELDFTNTPLRVYMKRGMATHEPKLNKYRLTFTTQTKTVPKYVYQAALMIAGHFYENRQDVGKDRVYEVPLTSRHLLERYRANCF